MNKTSLPGYALLSIALGLASTVAVAQERWDLATAYPDSNFHTKNLQQFIKDVETATAGALRINLHSNASLYKANEIKRAVQTGQAQAGEVVLSTLGNEDPIFGLDGLPGLVVGYDDARKLWRASKASVESRLARQGIKLLYSVAWPPNGIHTVKPVESVNDLKGIKWRAYNQITTRMGELMGARSVTIQGAELSQALATGVLEAVTTSAPTAVDSKMWEYTKYYYDASLLMTKNAVLVNQKAFDGLPGAVREAIEKAAAAAEERGWKASEQGDAVAKAELVSHGVKVEKPNAQLEAELRKISDTIVSEWLKRAGKDGKAILDAYGSK